MQLATQLDPEHWHELLERYFAILTDAVHRFEGTVKQYTDDGIMALFGAPISHEDRAQRACYAALHLQDALVIRKSAHPSRSSGWRSGAKHAADHPSYCSYAADEVG